MNITSVKARTILDSRASWTVEADVTLEGGFFGRASVPYGKSRGKYEAKYLPAADAVTNINTKIRKALVGSDGSDVESIHNRLVALDQTPDKHNLGANAFLSVEVAAAKAAAAAEGLELYEYLGGYLGNKKYELPVPLVDLLMGGLHRVQGEDRMEKVADNFQNTQITFEKAKSFREATTLGRDVYLALSKITLSRFGPDRHKTGEDGGFACFEGCRGLLDTAEEAIEAAGLNLKDVGIVVDAAASHWKVHGGYTVDGKILTTGELVDFYVELTNDYFMKGFEDPFDQDDVEGSAELTRKIGDKALIIGDDLTATNVGRLTMLKEKGALNSLLIKLNQAGSLWDGILTTRFALKNGIVPIPSHRSGETDETFASDLAVACPNIHPTFRVHQKIGAPAKGERVAKYNRLLRIEEKLLGQ
ncbi:Enolase [uncultured archaeon]|nr:Enolase [uncultured archaeon]